MADYNVDTLVRDPEFQSASFGDRAAILRKADPEGFGKLPTDRQTRRLMDMKSQDWWQGGANKKKTQTSTPKSVDDMSGPKKFITAVLLG